MLKEEYSLPLLPSGLSWPVVGRVLPFLIMGTLLFIKYTFFRNEIVGILFTLEISLDFKK